MGLRRRSREVALQVLFQSEFEKSLSSQQALAHYLENFDTPPEVVEFAEKLVQGVLEKREEIDGIIQSHSRSWKVNRMAFVDKNILRLAVYEMKFLSEHVPWTVAIDEAIEIGKRFGGQESSAFINGILDNISKDLHQ